MLVEDRLEIPYSCRRYYVTKYGTVEDSHGKELPTYVEDNELWVDLEWIEGSTRYSVGALVVIVYRQISLPVHLWCQIQPLHKDGNIRNNVMVNLTHRFRTSPLPVEGYSGYFYIPFFEKYGVNKNGDVKNIYTGQSLTWYVSKPCRIRNSQGGYYTARAATTSGRSKLITRHRALALAFLEYGADVFDRVVNHLNGVPGDDRIENIEWTTHAINNSHAFKLGLRPNASRAVYIRNVHTGKHGRYPTLKAAAEAMGTVKERALRYRLVEGAGKVFKDGWLIKDDDGKDFSDNLIPGRPMELPVVARNVFTGQEFTFSSSSECDRLLGFKKGTAGRLSRTRAPLPIQEFNVRYVEDRDTFPTYSDKHLKCFRDFPKKPRDAVIVHDLLAEKELFFTSKKKAAKYFNLTFPQIHDLAVRNGTLSNRYRFEVFKLKERLNSPTRQ